MRTPLPRLLLALLAALCSALAVAAELLPLGGRYVIDVRTPGEWQRGHIEGAVLVPVKELPARIGELLPDKNAPIALYCASGGRSASGLKMLQTLGYTDVVDYGGLREAEQRVAASVEAECAVGKEC